MVKKVLILVFSLLIFLPGSVYSQVKPAFSGEPEKFREELVTFMGPNLSEGQKANLDAFIAKWDSSAFSKNNMIQILDLSSQLTGRQMRAVPHFNEFLQTLNDFIEYKRDDAFISYWLTGLSELLFSPRVSNQTVANYVHNTSLLVKENLLISTGTVKWKVKNNELKFVHDTVFKIVIENATLTCYFQRDSTELFNVSGTYFPDLQLFIGTKGLVTWEKAGFDRSDVFAELGDFEINIARNNFTFDSARLFHKTYFKEPVYGVLSDQATVIASKERATYPRFETYTKHFKIENLYQGINYEGGLAFEGANVKGAGDRATPAKIALYKRDTLFIKVNSREFLFTKNGLNSQEATATIFLENDSIYHSNLGFSYNATSRQVNLFRTNNPVSRSPYYNSFHNLDMYFEYLIWDMNSSKAVLSRARGASMGQALFESSSFFNSDNFLRLMGLDDYHPLNRIKKFSEWYYSETFPVAEFAKWLNKSEEYVVGLCIELANKGFIYYDRIKNEITIKKKSDDYLDSFAKKKDYDVLAILSETKAPTDNAILDLNDYRLTVNGVSGVYLSDSQRVAIYPYGKQIVIGKNRSFEFDGVVQAGLFKIYGHNFQFSYDTFKINLRKIDSIRIAVETDEMDSYGNPLISDINNLIQLTTAELFIDDPNNKSGLKSLGQYPIINAVTYSYIFYDDIPGLKGIYPQKDFYFRIDPFSYENIDHYSSDEINLSGEFYAGNILKPTKQFLTFQENNSLGFNMVIPDDGIEIYEGKGRFYDAITMSNKGLTGRGTLKHLTSTTGSEEFKFFSDSMITRATSFQIDKDVSGLFPHLTSEDVTIKWLPRKDEWLAYNSKGKNFSMFDNGTSLDGSLKLTPRLLSGSGIINMTESGINSNRFTFASNAIKADTADYNLKSPSTSGYAFIAENVNTDINFDLKTARFRLNTDSSVVKFPELQYICTMTDFEYNMESKILGMEQRGKTGSQLLSPDRLLRLSFSSLDKPTFFATNDLRDTIAFTSWKGRYNVAEEYIEAEDINYIHIADALIQPANGKIKITRRAKIEQLQNAVVAVNNRHILHSAKIGIETSKRYSGSAAYDYVDENKDIQQITFPEITVDTLTTNAKGYIAANQKFMLSPAFSFTGDVNLSARSNHLTFTGAAGIVHNCDMMKSYPVKFKSAIDPSNIMIPIGAKPRDQNDNMVYSGSFINIDSVHIYPAFLSEQKSWADVALVNSQGVLYFDKSKGRYVITSVEKLVDPTLHGNMISFDKNYCALSGEGKMNFGANFDLLKMTSSGRSVHSLDSGKVTVQTIIALDFHFSNEALKVMSDDIRLIPSLRPVNLNSEFNNKAMKDLMGVTAATQMKEEMDLFGFSRNLPKEFTYELFLNDVNLVWNETTNSFRSQGRIGIGFVGSQPVNAYVDGYIEIQRRRSGDMIDIYLKVNESTWYYFSYFRGVMMAQAANISFNTILNTAKIKDRRDPNSNTKVPYTYMIAVEDRLGRFLRRMSGEIETEPSLFDGIIR
ncbi:MAG TPA: hypothetical protein VMW32_09410 [Bacteroidales bacterium]|nr:hypothetical protein [Bacteroidales bacterium]